MSRIEVAASTSAFVAGQRVECRDVSGYWWLKVACGPARYDRANATGGNVYLTVPVCATADWAERGPDADWINWPAEDVRAEPPAETPEATDDQTR